MGNRLKVAVMVMVMVVAVGGGVGYVLLSETDGRHAMATTVSI